jgi:phage virion morphogenesis protein
MARKLRDSQASRIRSNIQPDGSPMTPRKPQPKLKKGRGRLRRKMFFKISSKTWLKASANEHQAVVEFVGTANRLATIHHNGLKDRIKGREISYPMRELLGITEQERDQLETTLLTHLTKGL